MKNKNYGSQNSRRKFLKQSALGIGAASFINPSYLFSKIINTQESETKELKIAGYEVNRVKALAGGKVKINGFEYSFTTAGIGDLNTNTFLGPQDYDITEIGLQPFMLAYANDNFRDYILLPIFPLRIFRHKSIFIRTDGKIKTPQDLKGKSVGTPGYSSTSLTWIRGIFKDQYGVKPEDIEWVISSEDSSSKESGKISKNEQIVPKGISLREGTPGKDESDLLLSGEVDALFHAAQPKAFMDGNPLVGRLFPDSRKTEQEYYRNTGIFPIMHAIAVRKSLVENYPELVNSIFNAYSESKKLDYQYMRSLGWVYDSLPWYAQEFESTIGLMGKNFWPYGIEPNRKTLETLFRYSYEQGLANKELTIDELFHPSSIVLREDNIK